MSIYQSPRLHEQGALNLTRNRFQKNEKMTLGENFGKETKRNGPPEPIFCKTQPHPPTPRILKKNPGRGDQNNKQNFLARFFSGLIEIGGSRHEK
jgi:hypothetical protein